MELLPRELDGTTGRVLQLDAVLRVFVPAGEYDSAIQNLEEYLANPGEWSIEGLAGDPRLASIVNDPRFASLLETYGRP